MVAGRVPDAGVEGRLQDFLGRHGNVRHLDIQFPRGDSSRKKNEGAAVSRAPLIAFLDDDVVVAGDWPKRIVEAFADAKVGLASGPSLVPEDINWIGRLAGLVLSSRAAGYVAERYRQNRAGSYSIDWDRVIGCNAVYRREAFAQMGGFPLDFYPGEEMIAAFRTEEAGWKLMFIPAAWVKHYHAVAVDSGCVGGGDGGAGGAGVLGWVGAAVAGVGSGDLCGVGAGGGGGNSGPDKAVGRFGVGGDDSTDASGVWTGGMGGGIVPRQGFQ